MSRHFFFFLSLLGKKKRKLRHTRALLERARVKHNTKRAKDDASQNEASKCTTASRRGIIIAVVFSFDQQKEDH
jgi:hypothetical protein